MSNIQYLYLYLFLCLYLYLISNIYIYVCSIYVYIYISIYQHICQRMRWSSSPPNWATAVVLAFRQKVHCCESCKRIHECVHVYIYLNMYTYDVYTCAYIYICIHSVVRSCGTIMTHTWKYQILLWVLRPLFLPRNQDMNLASGMWMWVKMEDLGDHRC